MARQRHDFRLYSGIPNTIKCINCGKVLILKSDELEFCPTEMLKQIRSGKQNKDNAGDCDSVSQGSVKCLESQTNQSNALACSALKPTKGADK